MLKPLVSPDRILLFNSKLPFKGKYKNKAGLMDPLRYEGIDYVAIWVHPELSKKQKLNVMIHEALHAAYPDLTEQQVIDGAEIIEEVLWKAGYRKIKNKR